MSSFAQLVIPWLLWTGSALLFWLFVRGIQLRIAMKRWPRVQGVVREHEVHSHQNLHGPGHHRPVVIVEYSAAGENRLVRCNSAMRLGYAHSEGAQSIVAQFAIGGKVEIYLDPNDPTRAFLYPPETTTLVLLSLGSLFLLFVGVGMK